MANISTVFQRLMNSTNVGLDWGKAIASLNSNDPTSPEAIINYKNWVASVTGDAGNAAVFTSASSFSADLTIFTAYRTPGNFFNLIQSFGGLVEALGKILPGPAGKEIVLAGITITLYGNTLDAAYKLGGIIAENVDVYGWVQSITQTDAKREAEIYAVGLSISLGMASEATAKVFIDGSKSNDTGIVESVEYIKNIRKLLGLGTDITATTANDVYEAVQETRLAIQTLFGDTKFEITGVSDARNELPAFLSLYHLVPFAIKPTDAGGMNTLYELHATIADLWNDDRNLTAQEITDGKANFSDMWLADRKAMLGWVLKSNLADTVGRAAGLTATFKDNTSGIDLSPILNPSTVQQIIFGSSAVDTLAGADEDDHLYGGAGNDTINAGKGNDYIEGGADNDTLNGNDDALNAMASNDNEWRVVA